ncbi:MAG: metallophosphoesterase [Spirochaetales bacterium]|nr:metallophosphoesterase [Spirochaetales bacterium]MBR6060772.1 metallophosphoesterase [Spirochaetales bacterium]MBR6199046.1 metallophosphoesterase [Spirochaetales bacterium]
MRLRFNHMPLCHAELLPSRMMLIRFTAVIGIIISLVSCDYVDFSGTFTAQSTVDKRFAELDSLPQTTFDQTIDPNDYSFLIMSDCHYYKENSHHISNAAADSRFSNVDFIYINGDNVQSGQQYQYDYLLEDINSIDIPVYAGLGNHDVYNGGYELFKKYFGRTAYTLHIGDVDLFVMDTANGVIGTAQRKWIKDQLQSSHAKYKIVTGHCSPIDKEYVSACTMGYQDDVDFMFDLFERYNVLYCITGHLHEYDDCTVRGVRYIKINDQAKSDHKYAKVSVKNGNIKVDVY